MRRRLNRETSQMSNEVATQPNVREAVPFFQVTNIDDSLRFFVDGLGFRLAISWIPEGRIRWCRLEHGRAAIMLQEYWRNGERAGVPDGILGQGVSVSFTCADALALYHEFIARSVEATLPFVGNNMWVTTVTSPDGYRLEFQSPTDVAEETVYVP